MSSAAWREIAPAKINLCLFVGPVRPADGRHELVSVMQSLDLADDVTLAPVPDDAPADEVVCPGIEGENLAAAALAAFRAATGWAAPAQRVTIAKRIPVAAGLGGGSADAAGALRLAAAAAGIDDDPLLVRLAAGLGADVPAQVRPGRALALGAGEDVVPLPEAGPLGVLVLPDAGALATAAVYAEADVRGLPRGVEELAGCRAAVEAALAAGGPLPAALAVNDLAPAARALAPGLEAALDEAAAAGADRVLVAGSGPTVLGLFAGPDGPARARAAAEGLAGRVPAALAAEPVRGPWPGPARVARAEQPA